MRHIVGIQGVASLIFLLLVTFMMDVEVAKFVTVLYSIVWIPAIFISMKIYNAVSSEDNNSEVE